MNLPSISIVTCSYQQGLFIDATIRSVIHQGLNNTEYIIIDGGSSDCTVDVIRRYSEHLNFWVSEADEGQTDALIKGFSHSTGEIMGWLCSDDLLLPGCLEFVLQYFSEHPEVDFIYGDALWIDKEGRFIRPKKEMSWNRFVFLFDHNYLAQPSCFWRRSLYERVGGLDRQWNLGMDSDLWTRFARLSKPRHVSRYLSCMRYYPEQKTRALQPAGTVEGAAIRCREAPFVASLPSQLVKGVARGLRIAAKAMAGGYTAKVPEAVLEDVAKFQIRTT